MRSSLTLRVAHDSYRSAWALSIFLSLLVGCNTPEVAPTEGSGFANDTSQPDRVTQLRTEAHDTEFVEPVEMESSFGSLEGHVRDVKGDPIGMVSIQIEGLQLGAATGPNGYYFISRIPPDSHKVVVSGPGLRQTLSVGIMPDSVLQLDIMLE